jgi:hypothetical protein
MADNSIVLPDDSANTGKELDTESLTVSGTTVHRERHQLTGTADDDIAVITDTDPGATDHALVIRPAAPLSIQSNAASSSATAAGASDDLDSTQINTGKTGKLMQVVVSSTVAFKADIQTVADGVATTRAVFVGSPVFGPVVYEPPSKDTFTVAHSAAVGLDGFRVTFTNLDTSEAADGYATFVWDEV